MLRLPSTRIELTSSDVDWHIKHQKRRLARLEKGLPLTSAPQKLDAKPQSSHPHRVESDDLFVRKRSRKQNEEIPIYSDEPVPQESQAFWDRVLVEAGTFAKVHQASLARSPQVIIPSDSFFENNGSVQASVRGQNDDDRDRGSNRGVVEETLLSPRSPISGSDSSAATQIQSCLTPVSYGSETDDDDRRQMPPFHNSPEPLDLPPLESYKGDYKATSLSNSGIPNGRHARNSWANQMDVDGPSDITAPMLRHHTSTSSLQYQGLSSAGMPFGAHARKAELAASRRSITHSEANSAMQLANEGSSGYSNQAGTHSQQHYRTTSEGLRRSRLYISEAAASSSPHKHQEPRPELASPEDAEEPNPLDLLTRRRKTYKRRSESPSYVQSYASAHHEYAQEAEASSSNAVRQLSDHYQQMEVGDHPSTYLNDMSPHSRDNSWTSFLINPFLSTRTNPTLPSQAFHPLPLDFGASSRNLSASYNNLPSDENTLVTPHQSSSIPSTPPRSASVHSTPTRLSIYNDALPAHSQPQTPIGLPRNGLPFPRLARNPYFTAPARAGARIGRGFADRLQATFASPTRSATRRSGGEADAGGRRHGFIGGAGGVWRHEQENVDVEVQARGMARRLEEERRGREGEWDGERGGGWGGGEWEG
ncbi:MAG: hypothetical protein LQ350_003350 [Teloschistes chrysophthalmus]|nr:MAG: hypothetical protein LQ350_003350 [Niorma chrysophthalma]